MPTEVPSGRLSDAEVLRCVEHTVSQVLLPALPEDAEWPRAAAVQLIGLVHDALRRGPDPRDVRWRELAVALQTCADNDLVGGSWSGDVSETAVLTGVGAALAAAVGDVSDAARQVRDIIRPIVLRHLDDDAASTAMLVNAFRGHLDV